MPELRWTRPPRGHVGSPGGELKAPRCRRIVYHSAASCVARCAGCSRFGAGEKRKRSGELMSDGQDGAPRYKRVLLKISGEALMGDQSYGLDDAMVKQIAKDVGAVCEMGVQVCLVVGGGNIFRGLSGAAKGMERATADYMGMLATVINALAMQSALEARGLATRVLSAIPMATVAEPYIRRRAVRHMEKGRVVIFARRDREPLFHHRYGGRASRFGNGLRCSAQRVPKWTASTMPTRSRCPRPCATTA